MTVNNDKNAGIINNNGNIQAKDLEQLQEQGEKEENTAEMVIFSLFVSINISLLIIILFSLLFK